MPVSMDDEFYREEESWKEVATMLGLEPNDIIAGSLDLANEDGHWLLSWTGRRYLDNEEAGKVLSLMMGYEVKVVATHPKEADSEDFSIGWPRSGETPT